MRSAFRNVLRILALTAPSLAAAQITYPVEIKIGVHSDNAKLNTSLANVVAGKATKSIQVFEGMLSATGGGPAIGGRVMTGTFDQEDFSLKEGIVALGVQYFHLEGAYGERSLFGTDTTVRFIRAGAQSLVQIGGSGVALGFSGSKYFDGNVKFGNKSNSDLAKDKADGWEGETDIFYTMPKVPVYVQLGYRTEWFASGKREENVHAVMLGAGLWLGGR